MDQKKAIITAKRITNARAVLVRDNPFFGHLALGLQIACAPCGTACTDGERLIFDPDFAEQLHADREMEFVVLHEVLHCVLEHCTRGGGLEQELYNIACDLVVNSTILSMWGLTDFQVAGEMVVHRVPDGREGCDFSAEEIYRMLLRPGGGQKGTGGGQPLDRHDVWASIQQKKCLQDRWNQRIMQAVGACQGTTQLPQSVRKVAESLMRRSVVDWKQMLHDFIQHDAYDYSFLPPDRRFSDGEFYLPAYNVDEDQGTVHDIWVCVDTSGSISDQCLYAVMAEIQDAIRQTGMTGAVSFFDMEITPPCPFESEEEFRKIIPKGGGGTSFHVIFQYLQKKMSMELPKAILVFTDGYVWSWPPKEEAMGVPVLWLICQGGNPDVPWGQVAQIL